jgi:hypothetical protein
MMSEVKEIKFFNSFSNSKFELINKEKKIYLKKIISNPKIKDFESIQKNNFFNKTINIKNVKTQNIKIKSFNDLKKKKYFISEYIEGNAGDLILTNLGYNEIKLIKNFIEEYFIFLKKNVKWTKLEKEIVIVKLDKIKKKIKIPILMSLFKKNKKKIINELSYIKYFPRSFCHGDLTLSNMIITKKEIYLIDFLKTYNEGITQDLSKIYQEFILGWSARKLDKQDLLRSETIYQKIIPNNFFKSFSKKFRKVLKYEILMTLLRIFPYVNKNDKITINWLIKSFNKLNKKNYI